MRELSTIFVAMGKQLATEKSQAEIAEHSLRAKVA